LNKLGWLLLLVFVGVAVLFFAMLGPGEVEPEAGTDVADRSAPASEDLLIPVAGVKQTALSDTWGDSRGGGTRRHNAIDIMAPRGTPVVAAASGTVEKLFDSRNGGRTVYVRSGDNGTVYYYAHLDQYRAGLAEGQRVRTGDVIGTVGSTGSASPEAPHLHFEVKRMADGEGWWQGREVNPFPLLAGPAAAR
jgi:murein DD-endopeptidase MepM/ murein hydrolase activator NlpD